MRWSVRLLVPALALGLLLPTGLLAYEKDYPTRIIRIIAGPGPDFIARIFGPKITEVLGREVIVEPRTGGAGVIAARAVATAPPDGYTLLMPTSLNAIGTAMGTMPYDLRKDFALIGLAATAPFILVVSPSLPVNNVAELIAYAKANPGKLNYSSTGNGTPPHLATELFNHMAGGLQMVHVPYRDSHSAITAVMSGAVHLTFAIASVGKPQLAAKTVRGIAVTTLQPTPRVPDLPTISSVGGGLNGYEVIGWNSFVAPPGTHPSIVAKLNNAIQRGLEDPAIIEKLVGAHYDPPPKNTPEEFLAFVQRDTQKWVDLIAKANIKPN